MTSGTPPVTTWVGKFPVNPNDDQPDMDIMLGQAFYNQMVLVDPADASRNTVYIGGQLSSAKSTDGGATWRLVSNWLAQYRLPYVHADHHAAALRPSRASPILLFGTDGGLYPQRRWRRDVQQPEERRHVVVPDLRDDRQSQASPTTC